ncbi:MAG TPA: Uma2 family endonuclease [Candidatus Mediterraneibacter merdavium]|nr:Uma2 family endonuclease [Candidatus Mediterraneibacter merdavium]
MNLNRLKYYKQQRGYTFARLSELSGIPQGTIQKIFSGETKTPRYETIRALERVLYPQERGAEEEALHEPGSGRYADAVKETAPVYSVPRGGYTLEDYYALPDERRVELLDGVIYDMAAPSVIHQYLVTRLTTSLFLHVEKKGGNCLVLASPVDVQIDCDDRTMLEPDVIVVCDPSKNTNRCIMGAPDLVIEILSPSSVKMDTKLKMAKYATAGVREYWVIDPDKERVYVYWTDERDVPAVYGPQDDVPVGIFGEELKVSMKEIFDRVRQLKSGN